MNLLIQETFEHIEGSNIPHCVYNDTGVYESKFTTIEEVIKYIESEYGKNYKPIYAMKKPEDGLKQIGWEIHSKDKYQDTNEEFDCIIQITVHEKYPEKVIKYNYDFFE